MTTRLLALAATIAVLGAACADPVIEPVAAPTVDAATPGAEQPDPRAEELAAEVAALRTTLQGARDALARAAAASDLATAHANAEDAVHALTAAPAWAGDLDGDEQVRPVDGAPLLPGPRDAIPEDSFYGDQFARTLTAARAAGRAGGAVIDALRDPIVGDIGVWQADADAVLAQVDAAADPRDLDAVEAALADLPGAATRALTYSLVALRSRDLQVATTAAERASAHLDLTLTALDDLAVGT